MTFASIAGHEIIAGSYVHVPSTGPWVAECVIADRVSLSGRVEITIGSRKFSGTVIDTGYFAHRTKVRVLAGAAGWKTPIPAKAYHNDAGIRAAAVAEDAARACGEVLGTFEPTRKLGTDYARPLGAASRVLEYCAGETPWWVDDAGVTRVAARTYPDLAGAELIDCDPAHKHVALATDDPAGVAVGSVIRDDRLNENWTISEYEIRVESDRVRVMAYAQDAVPLPVLLRNLARQNDRHKIFGVYQYQVVQQMADRIDVQAVDKVAGVPDLASITQWQGLPGATCKLKAGAQVLVQFIAGDPNRPVITGYNQADVETISINGGERPFARVGDPVTVMVQPGIPVVISGVLTPTPPPGTFTGTVVFTSTLNGIISGGKAALQG